MHYRSNLSSNDFGLNLKFNTLNWNCRVICAKKERELTRMLCKKYFKRQTVRNVHLYNLLETFFGQAIVWKKFFALKHGVSRRNFSRSYTEFKKPYFPEAPLVAGGFTNERLVSVISATK